MKAVSSPAVAVPSLASGAAVAQDATLDGVVLDATSLVLPGVTVETRNQANDEVTTVFTDCTGRFAFDMLPAGSYEVTFVLPGFGTVVRGDVAIEAGTSTTLDIEMTMLLQETVPWSGRARNRGQSPPPRCPSTSSPPRRLRFHLPLELQLHDRGRASAGPTARVRRNCESSCRGQDLALRQLAHQRVVSALRGPPRQQELAELANRKKAKRSQSQQPPRKSSFRE